MARRKVEIRREEILDAAVAEVQERGLARARVGDVAAALGVSTALVFYHFDSKERLMAEAFEHAVQRDLDRLTTTLARAGSSTDKVARVLRLYAPQGRAPGWSLWVDAWAEALRDPALRSAMRRLDSQWKDALAEAIREGAKDGTFTCDDPDIAAWRLTALLDGLAVQVTVTRNLSRVQLNQWVLQAAAAELGVDVADLS